ncbi:MAG: hypothetical protein ACNS60_19755 [Candidatus Cyclobacteriaceae bacterium M2_1C_046]
MAKKIPLTVIRIIALGFKKKSYKGKTYYSNENGYLLFPDNGIWILGHNLNEPAQSRFYIESEEELLQLIKK